MSQIRQEEQIRYFISYAGSCLRIWNSIVGQEITHYHAGPGTIIHIEKDGTSIYIKVQFHAGHSPKKFLAKENLLRVFTHLTLSREVERDLEIHYWSIKTKDLLDRLRHVALQSSINESISHTFETICSQLVEIHQAPEPPEQIIEKINRYRQKLMDRIWFSNLSAKAMNPNVKTCFSLPKLDEDDLQLAGQWCQPPRNNFDRTSIVKARSKKDWELGRLLSARSAEKVSVKFYQHYRKKVTDISITQIDENDTSDYWNYDLDVNGVPIDVKNSRQSRKNPQRYTEHCIPQFKYNRENQAVTIAGVFSPYLWAFELLDKPVEHHQYRKIQFLGETAWKKLRALKSEFKDLVDFGEMTPTGIHFLPPWVFDYPEYVYRDRDKALKELKNFTNLDSLKGATFEFNPIPVGIAASIDLIEILDNEVLADWEQGFFNQLCNRIEEYGLSLSFLFLTILEHFLCMATFSKTVSNFDPSKYRKFLFCEEFDKPLGIYDPLKTIDALINALSILWTAKDGLIRKFRVFKLRSFNILQGKSDSNKESWTTLIAYCGGRLPEDGSACGKNPLVLGKSKPCEYGKLICPDCGFCCKGCEEENHTKV